MNNFDIFEVLTDVDDRYIISAGSKLGYFGEPSPAVKPRIKRMLILAAAVLLILAALLTTAIAAGDSLWERVFSFLGIKESVEVPKNDIITEITPDNMTVEPERDDIGGIIEGIYVHTPEASHGRNGVFLICTDDVMMNSGNHYDAYAERNGELVKLPEQAFCQDYEILGNSFHVEFLWAEHNDNCVYTYIPADAMYRKLNFAGSINSTMIMFPCVTFDDMGNKQYTYYPVLIDLETGELSDVLAGTGAEALAGICNAAISEDLQKMLLVDERGTIYYADLQDKKLYNIDELSGEHVEECSLIGNSLACWVLEDEDIKTGALGYYRAWTIDLDTLERRDTFKNIPATAATSHDVWSESYDILSQSPELWAEMGGGELPPLTGAGLHFIDGFDGTSHWGNMYAGSSFAVEVKADSSVYVMDLKTGNSTKIEGFLWPDAEYPMLECVPSPDGKKLLIKIWEDGVYSTIGVLSMDEESYVEFARENLNDINEFTIYWFDNDSVAIRGRDKAGGQYTDYYIYKLEK